MKPIRTELLIIGGGVVGAAIARALSRYQLQVVLVKKEVDVAFLPQCIHNGFGLNYFRQELTGPEYDNDLSTIWPPTLRFSYIPQVRW